jgi:hypothetical protein
MEIIPCQVIGKGHFLNNMHTKSISSLLYKTIVAGFIFCIVSLPLSAQTVTNYSFTSSSGTFTALSGATAPGLSSGSIDDGIFNALPIGFDFWYMGARYTTVSASTNGWLTMGPTITDATSNNLTGGGIRPVIAPLWDDLDIKNASNLSYRTTGTTGSRIFTVQYLNIDWNYQAWDWLGRPVISFQVKFYEGTGKIEFVYRSEAVGASSPSASIGISSQTTGSGNFLSVSNAGTSVSSTTEANVTTKPASGQTYAFTPPVPTAPGNLSFSAVTGTSMTLSWSDLSTNERGFVIYRSTDGVNYSFTNQVAAGALSSVQSGLSGSTTYYWRVYAVTEGGLSTALSGSRTTACNYVPISQIPVTSLIAQYKFEGNAEDATGNNNGTLQNAPASTTDRFGNNGKAYSFNGTNQFVSTSNSYVNPTNFTLSAWFKTGSTTGGKIIGFGNSQTGTSSSHDRAIYMNNAGNIYFGVYYFFTARTINSPLTYNDNNWHQVTATLSSTSGITLYIDGIQVAANASYTSGEGTTGYWKIGYDNTGGWPSAPSSYYFNGSLDDILIYHTPLSAAQVTTVYKSADGAGNNGPVCAGSPLNLTATSVGGATYLWSGPNGFTSTQQNPTLTYTPAYEGVYSVQVTSGSCSSTAYTIVASDATSSTISYAGSPFCKTTATGSVTLSGTAGGTYSSTTGLVINSSTGVITPTTSTAGTYLVTYSIPGGCTATTSLTINTLPTTANAGADQTGSATCGLTSITLAGNTPASGTGLWSIVSGTGGVITTPSSPTSTFTGTSGTTYTLRWTISNAPCTASTDDVSITLSQISNNQIDYTNGTKGVLCATVGENATATLTAPAGMLFIHVGFASYGTPAGTCGTFAYGSCHAATSQAVAETYFLGNNTGSLPATNAIFTDPCSGTVKQLYIQATYTQPICPGTSPGTITGTTPTGGNGTYTYLWEQSITSATSGFSAAPGTNNTINYVPGILTQTTWYKRTVTSASCTNTSGILKVPVTTEPSATISYVGSPFCKTTATGSVTFTGTTGGTYSSTAGLVINSSTGVITPTTSTAGTYLVTYSIPGGCTATTSVTVNGVPTTSNAGADQVSSVTCGLTSTTLAGNAPTSGTGLWSIVSGTGGVIITPSSPTSTFTGIAGNTYTLRWTISSSPCTASSDNVVITFNRNPTSSAAGPDQTGASTCGVTTVTLAANAPTIGTGAWSIISGTGGTITTPTSPTSTFTGTAGTTYTLRWTISNSPCPASTDDIIVSFSSSPSVSGSSSETCVGGNSGTITALASGGSIPYTYSLNAGSYQSSATFTGLASGTYTLNVKSNSGCITSTPVTVNPFATSTDDQNTSVVNTWVGHMYDGIDFENYLGQFSEPETFDESFGGSNVCFNIVSNSLSRSIYTESFSIKFRMNSNKRGLYTVNLGSDDGSRLTIDGNLVYNNWALQSFSTRTSVIISLKGNSSLLYEYYENGGGNQVIFNNLTQVLGNTLSTNIAQNICIGSTGSAISGDIFGTLPTGISLSGTGYQWSYSSSPGGARTIISGQTGASFTPSTALAPFNAPGVYYVYRNAEVTSTNNISPNPYTASNESNAATVTISALPAATISYTSSPYCINAGFANVTRAGSAGGTYSAPAGLSINTGSGQITLASSTPGTYTVTYTMAASGGCAAQVATTSVTITAVPTAVFSYAASPYSQNGGTANVTFSGTSGGTYSSTAGLTINASTGAITLATSTPGNYTVTYTVAAAGGCSIFTTTANVTVNIGTKIFTGVGNFSDPARWTDGTVPAGGENLIIDGTCTVDNNAGTDNVAYGTLTLGTATARTINWAVGGTNRLNVSTLATGSGVSTLDMTNGGTLIIRTNITAGLMNFLPGQGTLEIQASMLLPAVPEVNNLTINGPGAIVRLGGNITISGNLTITSGTLNSNNFNSTIKKNWINNSSSAAFLGGTGTVTFNGSTAQSIGGTFTTAFNNLTISNTSTGVSLNVNTSVGGNLSVTTGVFDLGSFAADRLVAGGVLSVSNNATLRIGGTTTFPANYTTNTLVAASTVEYYGTNQTVSSQAYGNLLLTSSAGAAVKTFPVTTMNVVGNLTSATGNGTSVTFTAAANVNVSGNITIGASTIFNGGSFSHTIGGNWINSGTFSGNTGTVIFNGTGKNVSGAGTQNFNNLTFSAALVTLANTSFTVSGNLSTISSGSFIHSLGGTMLLTGAGKSVSGSGITLNNLTVSGSINSSATFSITGNLVVNGSLSASSGTITMSGASKTISGAGSAGFASLSLTGSVTTASNFSVSNTLFVTGSFTATAGTATFTATSTLSGIANLNNVTINGTSLRLSSGSVLGVTGVLTIISGSLDATSSMPNTVNFNGSGAQAVNGIGYCTLIMSNGNTKTATGNITTHHHLTIESSTTFNSGGYTHSLYGNWINQGNFIAGSSTVQFLGPATGYITGETTFNILTINTAHPSTEIFLDNNINASVVNMTNGIIATDADTLKITGTRTGNGFILGNIQRTHAFTTGIAYAFEGPNNTIYFNDVAGVNTITVSVTKGAIGDFPFGTSISRLYNVSVPAGTYTAAIRFHYENEELNGNIESDMGLWRYDTAQWIPVGKNSFDTVNNYIEQINLTNITNRWTFSINPSVVIWNGSVSSDWNTPANWTSYVGAGSTPPSASDVAVVGAPFTHQPTISTAVTVKNLAFASNQPVVLTMAGGGSLVSGDMTGVWSSTARHTINVGAQTITVNGDLTIGDGIDDHAIDLNIGTGHIKVIGSLHQSGGANVSFTGAGKLSISKNFHQVSGDFIPGSGTVEYNGEENQHTAHVPYNNLSINKISGIAILDSLTNIGGDLNVFDGDVEIAASVNVNGGVNIYSGASVLNNDSLTVGGNWVNNGTYLASGSFITFNGPGTQSISSTTFNNLIIDKPVGSLATLAGNAGIKGDLTIVSGTLDIMSFVCDRTTPGGTLTLKDSATFIIGGNNAPANFAAGTLATSSTVIANGTGAQAIYGETYGNVIFRNSGVKTLITPITVNGTLTIENGAVFNGGAETLTINGNWVNNGTFVPSTGTVLCTGVTKTISGITAFNRLLVNGSYTLLNNVEINDVLNISSSASLHGGSNLHVTMNGDLVNSGVLYNLGSTTFTGNVLQTLSLVNAVQTVAITVNFNGSVSPVLNSTSAPQFGFLNINNTGGVYPSVGWTIAYGLSVGNGASFHGGNSTHNILGYLTNNGTMTSNGTINFIPASAATVNFGSNFSSTGTVNFGATGALTISGSAASFNSILISNTNSAGISSSANWNIAQNLTISAGSIFNAGSRSYTVGGDFLESGTLNSQSSTFTFNGAGTQSVNVPSAFNNLVINKSDDSLKFANPVLANGAFNMVAGGVDVHGFSLTANGRSIFSGGTMNAGTVNANGITSIFSGTKFGTTVNATSDSLFLNGSTFNNTTTLTKNGVGLIYSNGGNIFNGTTTITKAGTGLLAMGNVVRDIFNGNVIFTNNSSNGLYVALNSANNQFNGTVTFNNTGTASQIHSNYHPPATSTNYNGNIIVNNTSVDGGIYFGTAGGKAILANGKTITTGVTGFATGTLHLGHFTQAGSTPQILTLTGTGLLQVGPSSIFNGNVNLTSPQVLMNGAIYNGSAAITKTGPVNNNSDGGNVFNANATISVNSTGWIALGYYAPDIFNGETILNNNSTSGIYMAHATAGNQFNGDVTYNNVGVSGSIYNYWGANAAIAFNGNIIVNNTSTGGVYFGVLAGGSGTLASTKTVSVGSTGFTKGVLHFTAFNQLGTTPQELTLTGTALLQLATTNVFNGNANFAAPQLLLNGTTFNSTTLLTKSGASLNTSTGGNIYNGITTISNSGSGSLDLSNSIADIYNNDVEFNNTGTSRMQIGISSTGTEFNGNTTINYGGNTNGLNLVVARSTGSLVTFNGNLTLNCTNSNSGSGIIIGNDGNVAINGNIIVSSTSGRGVLFSDVSGGVTLGEGYSISASPGNFSTGMLKLARFTQEGSTAQVLTLSGTSTLMVGPTTLFNGAVNFTSPQLLLNGGRFNSNAILRKSGASDNASIGGNIYNGATTISNNGTGYLRLGNTTADDYNSDATFVQTGTGPLLPSYGSTATIAGNLSTAGTATAITFGSTTILNGTSAQAIIGSLPPTFNALTVSNTGNTVTSGVDVNIVGNLSVTSGRFNLGTYTANRLNPGGTLLLSDGATLEIGGSNTLPATFSTHTIGVTSTVEYSGLTQTVAILNSAQSYGHLTVSGSGAALNAGDVAVRNNVMVSGSLDILSNTLKIGGAITSSGAFNVRKGTIEMNGTSSQIIPASAFSDDLVKGLTINNTAGVSLAGRLDLLDALTVSGGSINTNDHLTLKSSDTATARVARITSASLTPVVGHVNVERYVPGRRKYRLITSSITTSTSGTLSPGEENLSIWGHWQNSGNNTSANLGNFITGGSSADGFDTQTPNASLFTYDDVNRRYVGFTTANGKNTKYTPLKAGTAYYMFVYGDRRNSIVTSNPNSTIIKAKGTIKTGDQLYNTTSPIPLTGVTGRYTMLGNPFASPINWATIPRTDLTDTYWGWDPNLSSTGGYVTVSSVGGVIITSPLSGSTGLNQYIQSGQGFFVKTSGAAPSMTIREQDKVGNFNAIAFRGQGDPLPLVAINLQYTSGVSKLLADGVVAAFDNEFSNGITADDASKMVNTAEGLAIANAGELLSIDARMIPVHNDTIFLNVSKLTKPQYTLQIFAKEMEGNGVEAFLQDRYLNTLQPLSLYDTNRVDFTVSPLAPASADLNRFRIVFKSSVILPVKFISVKAVQQDKQVLVKWEIAEESQINKYEIERSTDGVSFDKIGEVASKGTNASETYQWLDASPVTGNNYYRIRAVETSGDPIFSKTVLVDLTNLTANGPEIRVFPNPVQNRQLNLYINVRQKGQYTLTLSDPAGRQLIKQIIDHPGGSLHRLIDVNKIPGGLYYLEIINKNNKYVQPVMIE